MKGLSAIFGTLLLLAAPALGDPPSALSTLRALPHADAARLMGSWEVTEMAPMKMIYEFQSGTVAMHGRNADAGVTFELTMDADYRSAGADAIWVIATNPRAGADEEPPTSNNPSIMGIQFAADGHVVMVVSTNERFTLVKVP